jgi:hypothetical protein
MDLCNKHPVLYLGKDRDKSAYYFFGYKEKTGTILKVRSLSYVVR